MARRSPGRCHGRWQPAGKLLGVLQICMLTVAVCLAFSHVSGAFVSVATDAPVIRTSPATAAGAGVSDMGRGRMRSQHFDSKEQGQRWTSTGASASTGAWYVGCTAFLCLSAVSRFHRSKQQDLPVRRSTVVFCHAAAPETCSVSVPAATATAEPAAPVTPVCGDRAHCSLAWEARPPLLTLDALPPQLLHGVTLKSFLAHSGELPSQLVEKPVLSSQGDRVFFQQGRCSHGAARLAGGARHGPRHSHGRYATPPTQRAAQRHVGAMLQGPLAPELLAASFDSSRLRTKIQCGLKVRSSLRSMRARESKSSSGGKLAFATTDARIQETKLEEHSLRT